MDETGRAFWLLSAEKGAWMSAHWLGTNVCKSPLDLWIYQEILFRTRPDVIVETGTFRGGSALYLASICDLLGSGRVITIDIEEREDLPAHPRILYLTGSSVAPEIVEQVKSEIADANRVMVTLDSDHHGDHVLRELRAYGPLVTEGSYLVVEDMSASRLIPNFGPGPEDAVEEFMSSSDSFVVDPDCEKFLMTHNAGGYLKRVAT